MNRFWIGIIAAACLITGGIFFTKNRITEPPNKSAEIENENLSRSKDKDTTKPAVSSPTPQPLGAPDKNIDKQKDYEQRLRNEGFVDNPEDPYTLIKKTKRANGKQQVLIVPKDISDNATLEPQDRDKKTAEEIIESKRAMNPAEEIELLKRLDENDQNTMMLLGHFRDDSKDLEIFFGPTTDEKGVPLPEDILCLVSPKFNLDFKRNYKGVVRTDDTGYVILKANEVVYARAAWSYGSTGRILHGQVLNTSGGTVKIVTDFEAKESPRPNGKLKYCD